MSFAANPINSDADGVSDYDEINGYEIKMDNLTVKTDPLNPDSDGDGIPDGKEAFGYKIKIAREFDENGEPVWKEITLYGNPTKDESRTRDSDGDGISDYKEIHWKNYYILRKYAEKAGWNESVANQSFSPYIVWHFPAIVEKVKIEEDDGDWWKNTVYYTFKIKIISPVEISDFKMIYKDSSTHIYIEENITAGEKWVTHTFSGDLVYVKTMGYKIKVKATDINNNTVEFQKEFDGLFSGVLHFLEDIWNGIVGFFEEAAKAVAKAVNFIVEWIVNLLKEGFEGMIDAIKGMMDGLANSVAQIIKESFENRNSEKLMSPRLLDTIVVNVIKIVRIIRIMEPVEQGVMILDITMVTTETAVTVYTGGILGLLKNLLSKYVKNMIESKLILTTLSFISGFADIIAKLVNGAVEGAISMIAEILGISKDIAEMMESLAKALLDSLMMKAMSKYWWGFALVLLGFLAGIIPEMLGWEGLARVGVDGFLAITALLGFVSVFKGKKDDIIRGTDAVAPVSRETQMVIMYGAFAYALAKLAWDATHMSGGE